MGNLTRADAQARAALLAVTAYTVELDLTGGDRAEQTTFESTATIRFSCREPGATTFLDLAATEVHEIDLNGRPVEPGELSQGRVLLPDLATDNTVRVRATMSYRNDGQGLHRALDPEDGRHYVYGHLFLDAAPRVFGCFDQPDLKAPFSISVTAPAGWTVLGNGGASQLDETHWQLATTEPLASYFVTVCAGPYVSVTDQHDGIPLGLHARASLAEPLRQQAAQMLQVTKDGFDHYHRLFGIRYPFGEYHQVFVPEFNAGAMENPGCVTFRDSYIFRGAATEDEVLVRSKTIAHEMAHMWFGDLVTMDWWDDLWLNESFAEYMGDRTVVEITDDTTAWIDSTMTRKTWGYAAERTPSTHPVAGSPAPDADTALQNFDGISYAKGAAVLRQLSAHIGDRAFLAGITAYLRRHAFGNAGLADFLGAMESASGQDLRPWAQGWLRTAGLDTLTARSGPETGAVTITREGPDRWPADRPHTLDLAGWRDGEQVLYAEAQVDQDVHRIEVPGAHRGSDRPALLIPNASDLTWARVRLDPGTLAALPEQLPQVGQPIHRAVVWGALIDALALGELDPRHLLEVFATAWPLEQQASILGKVGRFVATRVLGEYLPPDEVPAARSVAARGARQRLDSAPAGSTQAIAAARLLAATTDDVDLLLRWAGDVDRPLGLAGDEDFRWAVLQALAVLDAVDEQDISRARDQDRSLQGGLWALTAWAARPHEEAKAWAWDRLTGDHGLSNYEMNALAGGFWLGGDTGLLRPYVARFHEDVPALEGRVGQDALARVATLAYPRTVVEPATDRATTARLEQGGLSPAVRRSLVDQQSVLRELIASRETYPTPTPVTG